MLAPAVATGIQHIERGPVNRSILPPCSEAAKSAPMIALDQLVPFIAGALALNLTPGAEQ
jgi:hypothetical protein